MVLFTLFFGRWAVVFPPLFVDVKTCFSCSHFAAKMERRGMGTDGDP